MFHSISFCCFFFRSLDETSRNVYLENVDLIESLHIYKQNLDELQKTKEHLTRLIATSSNDKELNEILIKEKVEQILKQNNIIKEVNPIVFFFVKICLFDFIS
jgi:hypothetical protein